MICGAELTPGRRKFCGTKCNSAWYLSKHDLERARKWIREKRKRKACIVCGADITGSRRKFCGIRCGAAWANCKHDQKRAMQWVQEKRQRDQSRWHLSPEEYAAFKHEILKQAEHKTWRRGGRNPLSGIRGIDIKQKRIEAGLKQIRVAKQVGFTRQYLSQLEMSPGFLSLTTANAIFRAINELAAHKSNEA